MKKIGTSLKTWGALTPAPELEEIQDLMPIDAADYERLENDIRENGFRDPLKVYQKGTRFFIIGGLNRWKIAQELDHRDPLPVDVYQGTAREYRELAIQDNLSRRHLTAPQKKRIAEELLKQNPNRTDAELSDITKIDRKTARKIRERLEQGEEIPTLKKRTARDGKTYSRRQNGTAGLQEGPQTRGEASGEARRAWGEEERAVYVTHGERASLEGILSEALKNEFLQGSMRAELESVRRKLAEAWRVRRN